MKKILVCTLALLLTFCLFACSKDEPRSGDGFTEMTGSIVRFYPQGGSDSFASFYSESADAKEITLVSGLTYRVALAPSFNGSRDTQFTGNCADFDFDDGVCEVRYIGQQNYQPSYELTVLAESDFELNVGVGSFTQTIKIKIAK